MNDNSVYALISRRTKKTMDFDIDRAKAPGFLRRAAATIYDLVLLFGVLLLAVFVLVFPYGMIIGEFPHQDPWHRLFLQLYLLAVIALYYGFFWVRGGQTLGLRTWRMRLMRDDGRPLSPADALRRLLWAALCLAPLGAGFLWMLVDRDRLTLYDRLSRTRPMIVKKD
jgi:uncharacterized RDD family membrane protein YckC